MGASSRRHALMEFCFAIWIELVVPLGRWSRWYTADCSLQRSPHPTRASPGPPSPSGKALGGPVKESGTKFVQRCESLPLGGRWTRSGRMRATPRILRRSVPTRSRKMRYHESNPSGEARLHEHRGLKRLLSKPPTQDTNPVIKSSGKAGHHCLDVETIQKTEYPQKAYELGKTF